MTDRMEFYVHDTPLMAEPFHYKASGLPNVYLLNGVSFEETDYGRAVTVYDVDGLHRAIAVKIVESETAGMSGAEMRFLRKWSKLTQEQLAGYLRVSEQTVANYEKGATSIPFATEFTLRIMVLLDILPRDAGSEFVRDLVDRLGKIGRPTDNPPQIKVSTERLMRRLSASPILDHSRFAWRETRLAA